MSKFGMVALGVVATVFAAGPAWAGAVPGGVPGPLLGAGIPALVGLAYVYRRIRKAREG